MIYLNFFDLNFQGSIDFINMNQTEQQVIDESILLEDESLLLTEMNRYVQDENGTCHSVSDVTRRAAGGVPTRPTGRVERVPHLSLLFHFFIFHNFLNEYFLFLFIIFRWLDVSDG